MSRHSVKNQSFKLPHSFQSLTFGDEIHQSKKALHNLFLFHAETGSTIRFVVIHSWLLHSPMAPKKLSKGGYNAGSGSDDEVRDHLTAGSSNDMSSEELALHLQQLSLEDSVSFEEKAKSEAKEMLVKLKMITTHTKSLKKAKKVEESKAKNKEKNDSVKEQKRVEREQEITLMIRNSDTNVEMEIRIARNRTIGYLRRLVAQLLGYSNKMALKMNFTMTGVFINLMSSPRKTLFTLGIKDGDTLFYSIPQLNPDMMPDFGNNATNDAMSIDDVISTIAGSDMDEDETDEADEEQDEPDDEPDVA